MPCLSKLAQPSYRGKDNDFFLSGINTIDPAKAHLDGDNTSAPHEHFSPGFALAPNKDPCSHIRHSPPLPERHDDFTAGWELLRQGTVSFHRQTAWLKTHTSHQITHSDLARLSSRPYSIRVSDPSDFASIWETVVVPRLVDLLQRHRMSEFAVDVHNFPEISSQAVPRIIHIALQHPNSINAETGSHESESLEQAIQSELTRIVPGRFAPLYVQFERGIRIQKSNWWYVLFMFTSTEAHTLCHDKTSADEQLLQGGRKGADRQDVRAQECDLPDSTRHGHFDRTRKSA